ncbi:MAG: DEAD/DEAH box helicase [Planctomycetota bacterium]
MLLLSRLSLQVPDASRKAGSTAYIAGGVRIVAGSDRDVLATVAMDGRTARVTIQVEPPDICVSCSSCLASPAACLHVWAALLAAMETGNLSASDPITAPRLVIRRSGASAPHAAARSPTAPWQSVLRDVCESLAPVPHHAGSEHEWAHREILFVIDVARSQREQALALELMRRERKQNGDWGKAKPFRLTAGGLSELPDPTDREVLTLLRGATRSHSSHHYGYRSRFDEIEAHYLLAPASLAVIVPRICASGRCHLRSAAGELSARALTLDQGAPWELVLQVARPLGSGDYGMTGGLRRDRESMDLKEPLLLLDGGFLFTGENAARFAGAGAFPWNVKLRRKRAILVPDSGHEILVAELYRTPQLPSLDLPSELALEQVAPEPQPLLTVKRPDGGQPGRLLAELWFCYDGERVAASHPAANILQRERRRVLARDASKEAAARAELDPLGFLPARDAPLALPAHKLPAAVSALVRAGWRVEAQGKLYRSASALQLEVTSGIDWFELRGQARFDGLEVALPRLLRALKRGENTVVLDDGTLGILPEEWMQRYGMLADLGESEPDHVRFARSQVGFLDALVASLPEAQVDEVFARARAELRSFQGVEPLDPPAGFNGSLRPYQREGLGWLRFLRQFGFGGCLADDMGLGKTVQLLALLEMCGAPSTRSGRGQVAVPGGGALPARVQLEQEAARFTPALRILDHTGVERERSATTFARYDVVITTYGTLRRDAPLFASVPFDYCVLDEAQAIKNATTDSAKAVRLVPARHRLALTGTPVENHLGELWSLFEFLNPGMLGRASAFPLGLGARHPQGGSRELLARALRPFLLRRTKQQVERDLPPKLEETIWCELEPRQRELYDELKQHYRQSLLERVRREGMAQSRIHVLEALLRLRQAACHPGLLDAARKDDASAKLDALLPRLREVIEEGHKALVFSQFTSLLAIVRKRLIRSASPTRTWMATRAIARPWSSASRATPPCRCS